MCETGWVEKSVLNKKKQHSKPHNNRPLMAKNQTTIISGPEYYQRVPDTAVK
jgi:hypothetical protein